MKSKRIDFDANVTFSATTDMRDFRIMRLRFIAKVALAGAYFIYSDSFLKAVHHDELRCIMNFDGNLQDPKIRALKANVDVEFSDNKQLILQAFRYVTKVVGNSSCLGLVPVSTGIAFFVGLLGEYIGMIEVPCNRAELPNEGIHSLGTFVCIQENRPVICSWERLITRIGEYLKNKAQTPPSGSSTSSS